MSLRLPALVPSFHSRRPALRGALVLRSFLALAAALVGGDASAAPGDVDPTFSVSITGGAPTIVGAWWTAGWNLNFQPDGQLISQGWRDTTCRGRYSIDNGSLRTSGWSCRLPPPLASSCRVRLSHTALVLDCPDAQLTFKRSEF